MMLRWRGEIFMLERKQMVKMSDIAEEAGVSIVTVSNALSGKREFLMKCVQRYKK